MIPCNHIDSVVCVKLRRWVLRLGRIICDGCGTGGTQWCARHVRSQGQVSSPPGFRLHRHLLMPPLFVLFHFSRTAVVCCACPASRSDRGVLSGCGGLARLTRPVARPGRLTARVPTSPASVDAPIFFLCHIPPASPRCSLLPAALPAALTGSCCLGSGDTAG